MQKDKQPENEPRNTQGRELFLDASDSVLLSEQIMDIEDDDDQDENTSSDENE